MSDHDRVSPVLDDARTPIPAGGSRQVNPARTPPARVYPVVVEWGPVKHRGCALVPENPDDN